MQIKKIFKLLFRIRLKTFFSDVEKFRDIFTNLFGYCLKTSAVLAKTGLPIRAYNRVLNENASELVQIFLDLRNMLITILMFQIMFSTSDLG